MLCVAISVGFIFIFIFILIFYARFKSVRQKKLPSNGGFQNLGAVFVSIFLCAKNKCCNVVIKAWRFLCFLGWHAFVTSPSVFMAISMLLLPLFCGWFYYIILFVAVDFFFECQVRNILSTQRICTSIHLLYSVNIFFAYLGSSITAAIYCSLAAQARLIFLFNYSFTYFHLP